MLANTGESQLELLKERKNEWQQQNIRSNTSMRHPPNVIVHVVDE